MTETPLLQHATKRDKYGLPELPRGEHCYIRQRQPPSEKLEVEAHNIRHNKLKATISATRFDLDVVLLLHQWVLASFPLPDIFEDPESHKAVSASLSVEEELEVAHGKEIVAATTKKHITAAVASVWKYLLHNIPTANNSRNYVNGNSLPHETKLEHEYLLRLCRPKSACKFYGGAGILCSGWRNDCRPAKDLNDLRQRGISTLANIKRHCCDDPSDNFWISSTNSVVWIFQQIQSYFPRERTGFKIAIIDVRKMESLGILTHRSDDLVKQLGGRCVFSEWKEASHEACVPFAWPEHFLTYAWIPEPCIAEWLLVPEFLERCKIAGINKDTLLAHEVVRVATNDAGVDELAFKLAGMDI